MPNYYDNHPRTVSNAKGFTLDENAIPHYPTEGLYLGSLVANSMEIPALHDLASSKALCLLYDNDEHHRQVNFLLERIVWRLAMTVPANLCDIVLYNGGHPGDAFNSHFRINKAFFDNRPDHVYFNGKSQEFCQVLGSIYNSIPNRMSTISCAGMNNLVELNGALGKDAQIKYQFIVLTDFPNGLSQAAIEQLRELADSGARAGIYLLMSWDMNAQFEEDSKSHCPFNPQDMLMRMELIYPSGDRFLFRNSGHDDLLNRFKFQPDSDIIRPEEINRLTSWVDRMVEIATKNCKPANIKQDYQDLYQHPYEPITSELRVDVGMDINDKHPVSICFNSKDYIHGFILGKSGSGKSVWLNNIITSAILKYSPADLMLYLMDFKGVEFNRYRGVKHTKAVLVENSDPQMTLEVLRELRDENKRRTELFAQANVSNINDYNRKNPEQRIPQILFVADECQVLFKSPGGDSVQRAIQLEIFDILNIVATQGRSQGIHMLLATQQLGGADISDEVLANLTECLLLMSAPQDSNRLVPDSSDLTSIQQVGIACYYHQKTLVGQVKAFYATNEELEAAIQSAQVKAQDSPTNGGHYFCGSSLYYLKDYYPLVERFAESEGHYALVGQQIKVSGGIAGIPILDDFDENILFFGANKEEQTTGVVLNALLSLIKSYQLHKEECNFLIIDCYPGAASCYKQRLACMEENGLCHIIQRKESGKLLASLITEVKNGSCAPTILTIIGQEKFIEMKRDMPLVDDQDATAAIPVTNVSDSSLGPSAEREQAVSPQDESTTNLSDGEIEAILQGYPEEMRAALRESLTGSSLSDGPVDIELEEIGENPLPLLDLSGTSDLEPDADVSRMSFRQALHYLLDEGPSKGVHTLLQVDNPRNVFFDESEYFDIRPLEKFRHKVFLRTENKFINPFRFSQELDAESLSDDKRHLRAYYYPDGEDPVLFTPFQMPANEDC